MSILTPELLRSFESSVAPQPQADTLPAVVYTSDEFLEFERSAIFDREWLCVGLASRIPEVGDWFTAEVNAERLIITRDKEGSIRALSAVCQHRAQAICEGSGNSTTFKCPYHHWTYGLDGRLLGAPAMERTDGFEKKDWGLPALLVEEWQGFVFVNFDAEAAPLAPTLRRYEPYLEHFDLPNCRATDTVVLEGLPWNWKIMFENFNDGYHANRLHQFIQDFCPSELSSFPVPWEDESNVVFREAGYRHIDAGFNATHRALYPVFPNLTTEERMRSTFALIPPTLCLGTSPDQAFFFIVRPRTAGTIDVEIGTLLHPDTFEHPMFSQLEEMAAAGIQVFVEQDQDATARVQMGLRSRFAPRGRYSWQEESHIQFNRWLVKRYTERWPV